jgi:hypothetical protein
MRTPAGIECKYFYGDYHRGRNREECRLLLSSDSKLSWTPPLCKTCPVPGILRANACENMVLYAQVKRSLLTGFKNRVQVAAYCRKTEQPVREPHIGCGECHVMPKAFHSEPKN